MGWRRWAIGASQVQYHRVGKESGGKACRAPMGGISLLVVGWALRSSDAPSVGGPALISHARLFPAVRQRDVPSWFSNQCQAVEALLCPCWFCVCARWRAEHLCVCMRLPVPPPPDVSFTTGVRSPSPPHPPPLPPRPSLRREARITRPRPVPCLCIYIDGNVLSILYHRAYSLCRLV